MFPREDRKEHSFFSTLPFQLSEPPHPLFRQAKNSNTCISPPFCGKYPTPFSLSCQESILKKFEKSVIIKALTERRFFDEKRENNAHDRDHTRIMPHRNRYILCHFLDIRKQEQRSPNTRGSLYMHIILTNKIQSI